MNENLTVYDSFEQRSPEWYAVRMGVVTASNFYRVLGAKKGQMKYMTELMSQILTKRIKPMYVGKSMEHGTETEGQAVATYELIKNLKVRHVAFIRRGVFIGCSPDGLVLTNGMLEIKCPDSNTHILWIIEGVPPAEHLPQMLGSLWLTEREWIDFVSFDPRFESPNDIFIVRVWAKDYKTEIKEIGEKILDFRARMVGYLEMFKKEDANG